MTDKYYRRGECCRWTGTKHVNGNTLGNYSNKTDALNEWNNAKLPMDYSVRYSNVPREKNCKW